MLVLHNTIGALLESMPDIWIPCSTVVLCHFVHSSILLYCPSVHSAFLPIWSWYPSVLLPTCVLCPPVHLSTCCGSEIWRFDGDPAPLACDYIFQKSGMDSKSDPHNYNYVHLLPIPHWIVSVLHCIPLGTSVHCSFIAPNSQMITMSVPAQKCHKV